MATTGVLGALTLTVGAGLAAAPAAVAEAPDDTLESLQATTSQLETASEDVSTSANMTHLANLPIPAAFDNAIGSDLAFQDDLAFIGSYAGFWVADISDPANPSVVAQVLCPGGQGDITVEGVQIGVHEGLQARVGSQHRVWAPSPSSHTRHTSHRTARAAMCLNCPLAHGVSHAGKVRG